MLRGNINNDSAAAAAAGWKELFFGVPERIGARAVAASGAGGEGDEGTALFPALWPPTRALVSVLPCALSWAKLGGIVSTGMGDGSALE